MLTIDTGDSLTSPLPLPPPLARTPLASFLLTRLLLDLQKSDTQLKWFKLKRKGRRRQMKGGGGGGGGIKRGGKGGRWKERWKREWEKV